MRHLFSTLCCIALPVAYSGTLEGVLTFEKRNPYVGLAYFSDATDDGPEICGKLDQKDKAFSKSIVVGKRDCDVLFNNSDDIDHNIFAQDVQSGVNFDVGLIQPGGSASTKITWHDGHMVRIGCKIHPKMMSYIANVPTRHFAAIEFSKDDLETRFSMQDVPEEFHEVTISLQPLDTIVVSIKPGETKQMDVTRGSQVFGTLVLTR